MADVIVVGGGIVGLSTAYWLTKAGRSVTLIERGPIPNPLASSADHHRLIRVTYGDANGYAFRIGDAFNAWSAMWDDLGGETERHYADTGILAVSQEEGDWTDRSRKTMDRLAIPYERIDGIRALAERFPFLEAANLSYGLLSQGGALMANNILVDLAVWLRAAGVAVLEHTPVRAVDHAKPSVELVDGRTLEAESVVIAAGVETGRLVPDLGVPLTPNRIMIVYAQPPADLREAWQGAPCWTDLGGNKELWGMAPIGALPLKFGRSHTGVPDPDIARRDITNAEMEDLRGDYRGRFRDVDRYTITWGQANYWTQAPDAKFVLKRLERAVVVSACSGHGFKFGALTGRDVAEALFADEAAWRLAVQRVAGEAPPESAAAAG